MERKLQRVHQRGRHQKLPTKRRPEKKGTRKRKNTQMTVPRGQQWGPVRKLGAESQGHGWSVSIPLDVFKQYIPLWHSSNQTRTERKELTARSPLSNPTRLFRLGTLNTRIRPTACNDGKKGKAQSSQTRKYITHVEDKRKAWRGSKRHWKRGSTNN